MLDKVMMFLLLHGVKKSKISFSKVTAICLVVKPIGLNDRLVRIVAEKHSPDGLQVIISYGNAIKTVS